MTDVAVHKREDVSPVISLQSAKAIASEYIFQADQRQGFDAEAVLRERPELREHKSVVLDLAYEEYLRRTEAGSVPRLDAFAARFPQWKSSLLRMLDVHNVFLDTSETFPAPDWPEIGEQFAGFQLRQVLGQGAFSRVYLARELGVGGRNVVVKACANVHSDANMAGRLQHPHVVPVYSVSHDDAFGLTAICMPYLGRATLYNVIENAFGEDGICPRHGIVLHEVIEQANQGDDDLTSLGRSYPYADLSYVDAILEIAIQIAGALKYVHRRGILHCDIKSTNVLLTASGEAQLFDFNLALAGDKLPEKVGGTLAYMAPEVLASFADGSIARDVKIDGRTDLYSFAAMLFELLTGKLPFDLPRDTNDRREMARLLLQQQAAGPASLAKTNPDVHRSLAEAIEKCLGLDPGSRPATAGELLATLQRERTRRRRSLRRYFLAAAAAGASGLVVCAGATAMLAVRSDLPPLDRAQRAYQAGKYGTAIEYYTQAIRQEPQNPQAHFERGNANLHVGQFDDAISDYANAERLGWDAAEARMARLRAQFHRGRQRASAGMYMEALRDFKETGLGLVNSYELERERQIVRTFEAYCLMHRSPELGADYQRAIRLFEELGKNAPADQRVVIHNNLGHCYRIAQDLSRAEKQFAAAVAIPNSYDAPCRNLAQVRITICEQRGQDAHTPQLIHQAVKMMEQAVSRNPSPSNDFFAMEIAARAIQLSIDRGDETAAAEYHALAIRYATKAVDAGIDRSLIQKAKGLCDRLSVDTQLQRLIGGEADLKGTPLRNNPVIEPVVNDDLLGQLKITR